MVPPLRERVRAFFDAEPAAVAVYLFGSTARGDAGPESDVDVAVLFDAPPAATLMGPLRNGPTMTDVALIEHGQLP